MKFKIKYQVSYELAILDGMCIYTYIYCLLFCLSLVEMSSCSIAIFRRVWSGWGAGVVLSRPQGQRQIFHQTLRHEFAHARKASQVAACTVSNVSKGAGGGSRRGARRG